MRLISTIVFFLVFTIGSSVSAFAEELGFIDLDRVLFNHPKYKAAVEAFDTERSKAENEFNLKAPALNENERRELRNSLLMNLSETENKLLSPIQAEIMNCIAEVATSNNLTAVLKKRPRETELGMWYGGKDLTSEVIAKLAEKNKRP